MTPRVVGPWAIDSQPAVPDPTHAAHDGAALERASEGVVTRLKRRGVRLSDRESSEDLVNLLEAVERFERAAERAGADLMVDEPLEGASAPTAPDDSVFVLPIRASTEPVHRFVERVDRAAHAARASRGRPDVGARGAGRP